MLDSLRRSDQGRVSRSDQGRVQNLFVISFAGDYFGYPGNCKYLGRSGR
jgi:hypothetical protein